MRIYPTDLTDSQWLKIEKKLQKGNVNTVYVK